MNSSNLLNYLHQSKVERIVDYFVVVGLPTKLTAATSKTPSDEISTNSANDDHYLYYPETDSEKKGHHYDKTDPIIELVVLDKSLNESVPQGFECLWLTKAGHSANLNHSESLFKTNHEMFLCIRRGRDMPPITDIGIYYEGNERVMNDCVVIHKTVGNNSANVNNNSFTGERIFVTYRRSAELACNSLAVIDICVIIKSKVSIFYSE